MEINMIQFYICINKIVFD